ncbi:MAG: hypothetical protein IT196_26275 [Acidimicrobiales bacterium]|nr:hypothetical protein [Acidimicrobiales bacterium]
MKTVQLRRYELLDGVMDEFVAWFPGIVEVRRQYGFTVEFAYADRAANQFVWAVSHDGDEAAFKAAEAVYSDSPERAARFAGQPQRVDAMHLAFVDPVG